MNFNKILIIFIGGAKSEKEQMEQDTRIWNFNFNIYFE